MGLGMDLAARRKDGTEFPVEVSLSNVQTPQGMFAVAFVSDISVRKRLEEERDSFFNISPDPLCIRELDGNFRRVNPAMTALFGRSEEELCSKPFFEFMHPDDRERTNAAIKSVTEGRPMLEFEDRKKANDGGWRWLHWRITRAVSGAPLLYAAAHDVTEEKAMQEKLRDLAGQLMMAQEEERRWIARELHDDVTQRLASLGIELGLLKRIHNGAEAQDLHGELNRLQTQILQLTEDIRRLSHSFHPSILEHTGLAPALEMHCREFTDQHGIAANFTSREVPDEVPRPVALALYRIAQESFRNIARHSGATAASVTLAVEGGTQLSLCIIDNGKGFDVGKVKTSPGLGLVSIEERARHIGGSVAIDSMPDAGTRLCVHVPLINNGE
jgi:PAS domain S-box-containing protein